MFGKKPDEITNLPPPIATRPVPPAPIASVTSPAVSTGTVSMISRDLTVIGNLFSHGRLLVDGEIQGDAHARQISVGEGAVVTGNVVADDVVIRGEVMGSVKGLKVTLQSGGKVDGDLHSQSLAIEHGAHFEGKARRPQDASELAPQLHLAKRS